MPFKKQPSGSQRTHTITVRFKPQVKDVIQRKIDQIKESTGREFTQSEMVRIAVWEYCRDASDPRSP